MTLLGRAIARTATQESALHVFWPVRCAMACKMARSGQAQRARRDRRTKPRMNRPWMCYLRCRLACSVRYGLQDSTLWQAQRAWRDRRTKTQTHKHTHNDVRCSGPRGLQQLSWQDPRGGQPSIPGCEVVDTSRTDSLLQGSPTATYNVGHSRCMWRELGDVFGTSGFWLCWAAQRALGAIGAQPPGSGWSECWDGCGPCSLGGSS
eukprot:11354168-Alexandrium_andersonii.AAC.1